MCLSPFLCSFACSMSQPQLELPWYNAAGLLFLTLHMESSCQLAAEKIACSANESKSNRDLFQIVSIHFSGLLIAVILEGCQKENTREKPHLEVDTSLPGLTQTQPSSLNFIYRSFSSCFQSYIWSWAPASSCNRFFPAARMGPGCYTSPHSQIEGWGQMLSLTHPQCSILTSLSLRNIVKNGILHTETAMVKYLIFLNSYERKGFPIIVLVRAVMEPHCIRNYSKK